MLDLYWYISGAKIRMLKDNLRKSPLKDLSVKLKALWFEVGGSFKFDDSLVRDLKRIEKTLESEQEIKEFQFLSDLESSAIFSFEGEAARMIDRDAYWVAVERNGTALLLVGSSANAIAGVPASSGRLSPSVDPLAAARAAFQDSSEKAPLPAPLPALLGYIRQTVSEPLTEGGLARPKIQGLAVFAGMFKSDPTSLRGVGGKSLARIVVGSPIYIRQR
jgi:hypothetical protein